MNPCSDADDAGRLSESEVSTLSQRLNTDPTSQDAMAGSASPPSPPHARGDSAVRACLFFLADVLAIYALLTLAASLLDLENLDTGIRSRIQHYSMSYFWIDLSVAMVLVAGCVMENLRWRPTEVLGFH